MPRPRAPRARPCRRSTPSAPRGARRSAAPPLCRRSSWPRRCSPPAPICEPPSRRAAEAQRVEGVPGIVPPRPVPLPTTGPWLETVAALPGAVQRKPDFYEWRLRLGTEPHAPPPVSVVARGRAAPEALAPAAAPIERPRLRRSCSTRRTSACTRNRTTPPCAARTRCASPRTERPREHTLPQDERRRRVTMQSERLAMGPLDQRDIERVAELLLRGLARKPARDRAETVAASSDRGTLNVAVAPDDTVLKVCVQRPSATANATTPHAGAGAAGGQHHVQRDD